MKFNKSVIQWNYLKEEDIGFKKHAIVAHQKKIGKIITFLPKVWEACSLMW